MSPIILATIFGVCHGSAPCIESVLDLYPQTQGEVILAYCSLYEDENPQCTAEEKR